MNLRPINGLRLAILLCCFGSQILCAQQNQHSKFDFVFSGGPLSAALIELSNASGIAIGLDAALLNGQKPVQALAMRQTTLKAAFAELLQDRDLAWRQVSDQISIYKLPPPEILVSGYIIDREGGERLAGATIYEQSTKRWVASNNYGFFSLSLPRREGLSLGASMAGYVAAEAQKIRPESQKIELSLVPNTSLKEIVVSVDSIQEHSRHFTAGADLSRLPLKIMPALGGEQDVLRSAFATQAGVSSGTDGFGGPIVRGGDIDHSQVLLDDAPLIYPTHGLGLLSIVNPDVVSSARLWKGDAPARLGNRLGGIMELKSREGNLYKHSASTNFSWIATRLLLEGPIRKEKGAYLITARRSLLGPVLEHFSVRDKRADARGGISSYHFTDVNVKLNWIFNDRDRVYASFYFGSDVFTDLDTFGLDLPPFGKLIQQTKVLFEWRNFSGALRWNHLWSDRCFTNTVLTGSRFTLRSDTRYVLDLFGSKLKMADLRSSDLHEWGLKSDTDWFLGKNQVLRAGFSANLQRLQPFFFQGQINTTGDVVLVVEDSITGELRTNDLIEGQSLLPISLYTAYEWQVPKCGFALNGGLRMEYFLGKNIPQHLFIQPRLNVSQRIFRRVQLRANAGFYTQSLRAVSNNGLDNVNDFWILSVAGLPMQTAFQCAAGPVWANMRWQIQVQAFWNRMNNLDELRTNFPGDTLPAMTDPEFWRKRLVMGKGHAHGLEVSARFESESQQCWASYTYSNSSRRFEGLNNNAAYTARFSRRHTFKFSYVKQWKGNWSVSANWILASGDVISRLGFEGLLSDKIRFVDLHKSTFLAYRLGYGDLQQPWEHRLEVACNKTWKYRHWEQSISLGAYNLYNRANRYFTIFYRTDITSPPDVIFQKNIRGLPLLPSLSWRVQF